MGQDTTIRLRRTLAPGNTPASDPERVGTPYLQLPDRRIGYHNELGDPLDLVPVTHHSDLGAYELNDLVSFGGQIYTCVVVHTAEPFSLTNFKSIATVTGTGLTFNYNWENSPNTTPPAGRISCSQNYPLPVPPTTFVMYANKFTAQNADISIFWDAVRPGDFVAFRETGTNLESCAMQVTVANGAIGDVYSFTGTDAGSTATEPDPGRAGALSLIANPESRIPEGGAADAVLVKNSSGDYDTGWTNVLSAGDF